MKRMTMTVSEMAQQLGISKPKAYELTGLQGFPVIKVGTRKIIPIDAFGKWLEDTAKMQQAQSGEG